MLSRDQVLAVIDGAYAARARSDKEAVATFFVADATYELQGKKGLLASFPVGPMGMEHAVSTIIDLVSFHSLERIDALVDGNRAAVLWQVTLSVRDGRPVTTRLYDLWELTEDGKARSLVQFTDTALLADQLASTAPVG